MAVGVKHYTKSGMLFTGKTHKMADGTLHTGAKHSSSSKPLFHFKDLPQKVRSMIMKKQKGKM